MTTDHKTENVLPFGPAKVRRDTSDSESVAAEMVARNAMAVVYLQQLSRNSGSAGKIPRAQRAQWARNVQSIVKRLKESGFGIQDLYAASSSEDFKRSYDDAQAYSKNLSAMQNAESPRQVVGYKKYLEFIQLADALTGEGLPRLVAELTEGVPLIEGATAIPEGCFELARQMEIIGNRVGKKCELIEKFRKLAKIRERHLCSGGDCVWPDSRYSFEDGAYTPVPGLTIAEVSGFYGEAEPKLMTPEYYSQSIGSLRIREDDEPLVAEGKQSLRARLIEYPAARRLAKNTYFTDSELATDWFGTATSNKTITIGPWEEQLLDLPVHYGGVMVETDFFNNDEYVKGQYLIRAQAELAVCMKYAFELEELATEEGSDGKLLELGDGFQLAIFLYPNEKCDGLIPIIKLGAEEGMHIAPLDAQYISMLSESVVFPKGRPRVFPYQTESLMSYLKQAIATGQLEADWERTSNLIDQCPLWNLDT